MDNGKAECFGADVNNENITPEEVLSQWSTCIENGDPYALELREYITEYFAPVAAMLINCYDPNVIILAGYISAQISDALADSIRHRIPTDVYDHDLRNIDIREARAGKDALIKGVASAVLQNATDFK